MVDEFDESNEENCGGDEDGNPEVPALPRDMPQSADKNSSKEKTHRAAEYARHALHVFSRSCVWLWRKVITNASFWTAAATVAIAVTSYYQWRAIKRQWEEMQKQSTISSDTAKRQFRAYVQYESGKLSISKDGQSYTIFIEIKNTGQTPAYSVRHWIGAAVMDRVPDPLSYFYPPNVLRPGGYPPSQHSGDVKFKKPVDEGLTDFGGTQSVCLEKTFPLTDSNWRNKIIYAWGHVTYDDQFRRPQSTAFVRQTVGPMTKGGTLRFSNILSWTAEPSDAYDADNKSNRPSKFPWNEEPQSPNEPMEISFQGACPAN